MRYVDDTFVIQWEGHKETFLEHNNKVDQAIKFTVKGDQENGTIPFLDNSVKPETDNTLSITVYRKPMHSDQYLQWDSHHNLVAKCSVTHRGRTVCIKLYNKEIQHLRKALTKCKYPKCALDKVERKFININQEKSNARNTQGEPSEEDSNKSSSNATEWDPKKDKYSKGHIVIPYIQALGESIKKICKKYGIQTHLKGSRTTKEILVKSKDKNPIDRKSGDIYWYQCREVMCSEEYIGKTSRTFGERYKEHLKEPSPFFAHSTQAGQY